MLNSPFARFSALNDHLMFYVAMSFGQKITFPSSSPIPPASKMPSTVSDTLSDPLPNSFGCGLAARGVVSQRRNPTWSGCKRVYKFVEVRRRSAFSDPLSSHTDYSSLRYEMSSSWIRILLLVVVALLALGESLERDARAPRQKFIRFGRAGQKFIRFGRSGPQAHQLNLQELLAANQIAESLNPVDDLPELSAPAEDDWQQLKHPKFFRFE
uniref:Uncharacterized protein n=1 Tax=Steinernema glaseri TaxID=37863 RepID=A0A1I7YML7_9BILA